VSTLVVTVAGAVGLAGLASTVAFLVYLHAVPTGLSPLRNAVSQYGLTAYRGGYRGATFGFAVAGVAAAAGLGVTFRDRNPGALVALLLIFAVTRAIISWFPMDAPGTATTVTGQTHRLLAFLAFGAVAAAAFVLSSRLQSGNHWQGLAPISSGFGWAMLAFVLGMVMARENQASRQWFGAAERGFYLVALGWFAVFTVACVT
jgi:hypothetical protein